jgi:hypothetical protein
MGLGCLTPGPIACLHDGMDELPVRRTTEELAYSSLVTFLEGLADFHPEFLKELTPDRRRVLGDYYWFGRDIDIDDIFAYRRALLAREPEIKARAEAALAEFFRSIGVENSPTDYEVWSTPA